MTGKIGLSRFVLGFLGLYLAGIFFGNFFKFSFVYFLMAAVFLIGLSIIFFSQKFYLLILISLIGLCLGLANYRYFDQKENVKNLSYGTGKFEVLVKTSIVKNNLQQIVAQYQTVHDTKIIISAPLYPQFNYGDKLAISGTLENPAGVILNGFDYGNYLYKQGIRGTIRNPDSILITGFSGSKIKLAILKVGDKFTTVIDQELPEPMSTLMIGLIMGLKQQLPDSVMTAFQRDGLSHVTAVSGYNVTIVIIWISFLLTYISRRVNFIGTILATIVFVVMTGAGASVMRAGILAILVVQSKFIGRKVYYPILILLVADLMLFFNPYALKNDISFQLSFLAFAGLLVLSTPISQNKLLKFIPENLRGVLSETLGAQILALPILIYSFGLVSIIAPLSNILILPIIPGTMLLGFISGLAGMIYIKFGIIFANVSFIALKYILVVVENLSRLPWAAVQLKTTDWWWIPLYYLLVFFMVFRKTTNEQSYDCKE